MRQLLNPELTASWEKGLTYVAEGTITPDEYMEKLERFVTLRTNGVKQANNAICCGRISTLRLSSIKNSATAQCLHSCVQKSIPKSAAPIGFLPSCLSFLTVSAASAQTC